MRQVLGAGALGRPRGVGWGGRWEGGSGWRIHVNPWLIHVNVWQKPLQYYNQPPTNKNERKKKKKEFACNTGGLSLIPGLGRSPREGNRYPLQYSCLENSMNKRAWQSTVRGVTKSWTGLSNFHFTSLLLVLKTL